MRQTDHLSIGEGKIIEAQKGSVNVVSGMGMLVLVCFFSSGISGLIYQILWTRMIVKVIGGAPYAVSVILTIFMGGLGLGAWLVSRYIDRFREAGGLLRMYGVLELAIGIYAGVIPILLKVFLPLYSGLYNQLYDHYVVYNLLTFLGVSIILCIPVICMGATLPVLCQFYVSNLSHLGTHVGRLYGLNTIGAAVGAFLCGFWLIEYLGVTWTLVVAVLINCLIGLLCVLFGPALSATGASSPEKAPAKPAGKKTAVSPKPVHSSPVEVWQPPDAATLNGALAIFAVSGFCAMAYEVIWTKLLGLIVGPTTYSFTIVLVTFILGLGLGSVIFGWFADRVKKPVWLLIASQVAAALFVLIVSQLLGNSQIFFAKLIYAFQDSFAGLNLIKTAVLFLFMILPTLCLGATFPLVGKIYTQSVAKVGSSLGFAYMINTAGAVLGSFGAGYLLIPLIGKENGLSLVIGLQFLASAAVALVLLFKDRQLPWKRSLVVATALAGLVMCFFWPMWNRHGLSQGKYHRFDRFDQVLSSCGWWESLLNGSALMNQLHSGKLVYYGDGIGGFTTVIQYANPLGRVDYTMVNSGKSDASSHADMGTQTLSAHFPMLLHPNPRTVMVLGLASGVTAGEVLNYPVKKVDVLEISREVVKASNFFRSWNGDVLSDPRTKLIVQDGRAHLQLTGQKYDVIVSEPSNPWMAGLAALFTGDFFSLAHDRLTEGGIFAQFIHSYQMDWPTFAMIGRTFAKTFPDNLLVSTDLGNDFLMIGFKGGKNIQALARADYKAEQLRKLKNVNLPDARLLYLFIVSEDMQKLFGEGDLHSDAMPRLEFMAPRSMYINDPMILKNMEKNIWLSPQTNSMIKETSGSIDQQINFFAYSFSVNLKMHTISCPEGANPAQKERFFKLVEKYCADNVISETMRSVEVNRRCIDVQIRKLENSVESLPDKVQSYRFLADLYQEKEAWGKASIWYARTIQSNPGDALAHEGLAIALCQQGVTGQCIAEYREALRLQPDLSTSINNLSWVLATSADPAYRNGNDAVGLAHQACERTRYRNPFALDTLAAAYAAAGRYEDAVRTAERSISLLPEGAKGEKIAEAMQQRLILYRSGRAYTAPPVPRPARGGTR